MDLQVIGAGLGRTGTGSLKIALEHLLGAPCYHMYEVLQHPHHVPLWHAAVRGEQPDWDAIYAGYAATTDWPGAAFWRPLAEAAPNAVVLLSTRSSTREWYESATRTIEPMLTRQPQPHRREWHAMARELIETTFTALPFERTAVEAAYERHNAAVRATADPSRLLEWTVGDGWEPLCERLGVAVPDEPFPHRNKAEVFEAFLSQPEPAGDPAPSGFRRLARAVRRRVRSG